MPYSLALVRNLDQVRGSTVARPRLSGPGSSFNRMPTCEICAMRDAGDKDRADAAEVIRSYRLLLSMISGAVDATGEVSSELHGCTMCIGRLAGLYLGMHTGLLVKVFGDDADAAATAVQATLAELIDEQ